MGRMDDKDIIANSKEGTEVSKEELQTSSQKNFLFDPLKQIMSDSRI